MPHAEQDLEDTEDIEVPAIVSGRGAEELDSEDATEEEQLEELYRSEP